MTADAYDFELKTTPPFEEKVWGSVLHLFYSDHAGVSWLKVRRGFRCSKHYHLRRRNTFLVTSGRIAVELFMGDGTPFKRIELASGESCTVLAEVLHRFEVLEDGEVIEVYHPASPDCTVSVDDIVRLDEGGRCDD